MSVKLPLRQVQNPGKEGIDILYVFVKIQQNIHKNQDKMKMNPV
jgi:hypothetical protein